MRLFVLVGVAGVGKSTFAKGKLRTEDGNGVILSSDDYRLELFGSLKEGNGKNNGIVFQEMHKDLKNIIEGNEHDFVIYDATNINRKRRRALYRNVKEWSNNSVDVEIIYFSVPLKTLYENNTKRELENSDKELPREVIFNMYKQLQVPRLKVDCDFMGVVGINMFDKDVLVNTLVNGHTFSEAIYKSSIGSMADELGKIFESHDCEPYHLESIYEHIDMCVEEAEWTEWENSNLIQIAQFHDLGKSITKEKVKKNGTTKATYLGHADVSANYLLNFLQFNFPRLNDEKMDIVEAVHQHMNAHKGIGEKNIQNNNLNENVLSMLNAFVEIDNEARVVGDFLNR